MAQLSDLEYLKLSKGRRLGYKLGRFFVKIPKSTLQVFQRIWEFLKLCVTTVGREAKDIITTFVHPNSHPYDSDVLIRNGENKVVHFREFICAILI